MKKGLRLVFITAVLVAIFTFSFNGLTAEAKSGKWKKDAKGCWYSYSDGTFPKNGWAKIGKKWYYFDKKGYMQTGWIKEGSRYYYTDPLSGCMATGWKRIARKYYYFLDSGVMEAGAYRDGYWLEKNGAMNQKNSGGKWMKNARGYWFQDSTGWYPKNRWLTINGNSFYFDKSGYRVTNKWVGNWYVGSTGACEKKAYNWRKAYYDYIVKNKLLAVKGDPNSDDYTQYLPWYMAMEDFDNNGMPEIYLVRARCTIHSDGKIKDLADFYSPVIVLDASSKTVKGNVLDTMESFNVQNKMMFIDAEAGTLEKHAPIPKINMTKVKAFIDSKTIYSANDKGHEGLNGRYKATASKGIDVKYVEIRVDGDDTTVSLIRADRSVVTLKNYQDSVGDSPFFVQGLICHGKWKGSKLSCSGMATKRPETFTFDLVVSGGKPSIKNFSDGDKVSGGTITLGEKIL